MQVLAQRDVPGYPGMRVNLCTNGNEHKVIIQDPQGAIEWGTTQSRAIARDWFFHPFVYGYDYRPIVTDTGSEDGA